MSNNDLEKELANRYNDEALLGKLSFSTELDAYLLEYCKRLEKRIAALELVLEQEKQQLSEWDVMLEEEKADFFNSLGDRDHG